MKNRKAFILYEYNQFKDDYTQIMEYYSVKELQKDNPQIKGTLKNLYNAISLSLDSINRKINDKYIIIKEEL